MKTIQPESKGTSQLENICNYKPISIVFEEIDENTIQVDCYGIGAIKYYNLIDDELKFEISTSIKRRLLEYTTSTGHNSSEIGFYFRLIPTKKLNRKFNTLEAELILTIVFRKPIQAPAFRLLPTIELISATIVGEIFILQD